MKKSMAEGNLKLENIFFYSLIFFLPTQLGKHFWPDFSYVLGIRIDYLSPAIFLTDIFILLLFIVWLIKKLLDRESEIRNYELWFTQKQSRSLISNSLFIILFLFLIMNIVLSGRIFAGMNSTLKFFEIAFVAYYTAKFVVSRNVFENTVRILSTSIIFQSLLAIAQFVRQGSIGGLLYYVGERSFSASTPGIANASLNGELVLRPYATFPHPNVLAGFLVVVMTLILFSLRRKKYKTELRVKNQELKPFRKQLFFLLHNSYFLIQATAVALGTIALFLSMSRIAILLWIFICVYYVFRKSNRVKYSMFILVVICLLFSSPIGSRFIGVNMHDEAVAQRRILTEKAFEMIKTNPVVGVGLGNFIPVLAESQKPLTVATQLQPVHNIFLLVAAETGIVGLGFFMWLLWKTFFRIMKQELKIKEPLFIVFLSILTLGLFDHYWLTLQQGQLLLGFIIGICWVGNKTYSS